jgi:hypothetical protein
MTRGAWWIVPPMLCLLAAGLLWGATGAAGAVPLEPTPTPVARVRLPLMLKPDWPACPTSSANSYAQGTAYQRDRDNPVRPAAEHADKNLELRGYEVNNDTSLKRELVDYGPNDPTRPPQFATLFAPYRVPPLASFYRVHDWEWAPSPDPGTRGGLMTTWRVTVLGLRVEPGETLHVPVSDYDLGLGFEVIVLHADERRLALHYGREDSAAVGYTVHIEGLCTDPSLLALYNELNAADGPRYVYPINQYPMPILPAGKPIGVAHGDALVVAIVDSGSFMDPRSCNEWWKIRPGYTGSCPPFEVWPLRK